MDNQARVEEITQEILMSINQAGPPGTYPAIEIEKLAHRAAFWQEKSEAQSEKIGAIEAYIRIRGE